MADLRSDYNRCLYHSTAALSRSLTRLAEKEFRPLGITPTMGFILMTTKAAPGIIINDLALIHQLDASTISRALDKLAAQGHIVREGLGREMRIFSTESGLRTGSEAQNAWNKLQLAYQLLLSEGRSRHLAEQVTEADAVLRGVRHSDRKSDPA